jgi:hypothetical protein
MEPTINSTKIQVYKISDDAEPHEFRNRLADKENSYELLDTVKVQVVWYSHEELRQLESIDRIQSSGYFIFKNVTLNRLGINPSPDGGDWNRYRFKYNINGSYSNRFLEVVEMRPESPHRGQFKLWYAYFHEVRPEPNMSSTESPTENSGDTFANLRDKIDLVRQGT